ncbi:uncharacterized protein SAPINGB_P004929 [Magnusiomyces paraingens]|uniref:Stress response RCI peptide n=1 Tax=Magnusiomyces paraingens TaxID=2606893 RepID=A0A5E8C3D3_9ASCO|nr:uncharacterized protein SAPINGB_P004929 [Saprochaete ingens]VVT56278.1 unnamed protein product [Saprochaete ingens]
MTYHLPFSLTHLSDSIHHLLQAFIQNIHYPIAAALALMCICWFFCSDCFLVILAIFFPPLPVWIRRGCCSIDSFINIALCCLGYLPGLIHSWYIIAHYPEDSEVYEYDYESQSYYGNDHHHHHHHHYHDRPNGGNGGGFSNSPRPNNNGYIQVSQTQPPVVVVTSPATLPANYPVAQPYQQQQQAVTQTPQSQSQQQQQPLLQQLPQQLQSQSRQQQEQEQEPVSPRAGPSSSSEAQYISAEDEPLLQSSKANDAPQGQPPSYDDVIRDTIAST